MITDHTKDRLAKRPGILDSGHIVTIRSMPRHTPRVCNACLWRLSVTDKSTPPRDSSCATPIMGESSTSECDLKQGAVSSMWLSMWLSNATSRLPSAFLNMPT